MFKLIITIISFSLCIGSFGQTAENIAQVEWGSKIKVPKGKFVKTYDFEEGSLIHIWKDGEEFNILETNNKMEEIKRGNIKLIHKVRPGKWYYEKTFRLGDNIYVLSKIKDKKVETFFYYLQEINLENFNSINQPILITEMSFLRSFNKEIEDIGVSPDYSHLYVGHNNAPRDRSKYWYEVKIFDTDLEEEYSDRIELDNDASLNTVDFKFNKNGDAAVIARRIKPKEDREKGKPKAFYTAAVLRNGETNRYKLDLDAFHISDIQVTFGKQNELIIAGYYSTKSEMAVNGIFYISETGSKDDLEEPKLHEFSVEEITKFESERTEAKASKKEDKGKEIEFKNYDVRNIEVGEDGIYLIGEQFYVTVRRTSSYGSPGFSGPPGSNSSTRTEYQYNFMDVMVVKLDLNGDMDWVARVPKHNFSKSSGGTSSGMSSISGTSVSPWMLQYWSRIGHFDRVAPFASYNYTMKDGKFFILYNDHVKNHIEYNPKKIKKSKKGGDKAVTVLAKIDNDGNLTRDILYNVKEEAVFTQVRRCVPLDNEAGFFILAQKKGSIKLGRCVAED